MTYGVSDSEVKSYGIDKFFIYWSVMFVLITLVKYDGLLTNRLVELFMLSGESSFKAEVLTSLLILLLWILYIGVSLKFIVFVARFMFSYKFETDYNKTYLSTKKEGYLSIKEPFSGKAVIVDERLIKKVKYASYRDGVYVYVHVKTGLWGRVVQAVLLKESFSDYLVHLNSSGIPVREKRMFGCRYLISLFVDVFHKTV